MNPNPAKQAHIYEGQYRRFRDTGCTVALRGYRAADDRWRVADLLSADTWWETTDWLESKSRPLWVQKGDGLATQRGFRVGGIIAVQGLLRLKDGASMFWDLERAESLGLTETIWTTKQ